MCKDCKGLTEKWRPTEDICVCQWHALKPIWTSRLEGGAPPFPSHSQLTLWLLSHFDPNRWFAQQTIFIRYNAKLTLYQEPVDLCEQDVISLSSSPAVFNHFCRPSRGSQSESTWAISLFRNNQILSYSFVSKEHFSSLIGCATKPSGVVVTSQTLWHCPSCCGTCHIAGDSHTDGGNDRSQRLLENDDCEGKP